MAKGSSLLGRGARAAAIAAVCAVAAMLVSIPALASQRAAPRGKWAQVPRALRLSRDLWATIDVCDAPDQRNTIGIRGSMPADGQPHDTLFMRFRLQYMDTATQLWTDLTNAASEPISVGSAKSARQAGRSFVLVPQAGKPAVTLRGVVSFQWRRGAKVVATLSRPTSAGHQSLAGADPANFSAATCRIG